MNGPSHRGICHVGWRQRSDQSEPARQTWGRGWREWGRPSVTYIICVIMWYDINNAQMYNINNKYIHLKMKSISLIPRLSLYLLRMKLDYNVSSEGITVLSEVYIIWTWTWTWHGHLHRHASVFLTWIGMMSMM